MTVRNFYQTEEGELVGPKMKRAVSCVESNGPYSSMYQLATTVGPNGSSRYGYKIVKRCLHKNLIDLDPDSDIAHPNGRGAVVLTEKGSSFLDQNS